MSSRMMVMTLKRFFEPLLRLAHSFEPLPSFLTNDCVSTDVSIVVV